MTKPEKRYYWLRLKDDFFNNKEVKKLRRIAGGDTFTIIYLKMQLLSINDGGCLIFDETEENLAEQLAIQLDEKYEDIMLVLNYMERNKLIEKTPDKKFLLPKVPPLIGNETTAAERMRKMRERNKCNKVTPVLQSVTQRKELEKREKRKEIKEEKRKVFDFIYLTEIEHNKLLKDYGLEVTDTYLHRLDDYIGVIGEDVAKKKYKSHYHVIKSWYRKDKK